MRFTIIILALIISSNCRAQWIQTNGPYGASSSSLFSANDKLYAAAHGSGLYLSADTGQTWSRIVEYSFSSSTDVIGAWGDTFFINANYPQEILLRSTDAGLTLDTVIYPPYLPNQMNGNYVNEIYADSDVLIVCRTDTVLYSFDLGDTWQYPQFSPSARYLQQIKRSGSSLFGICDSMLFKSVDNGMSWFSVLISDTNYLYAFALEDSLIAVKSFPYTYVSTDLGTSWTSFDIPDSLNADNMFFEIFHNDLLYASQYNGAFTSADTGKTWIPVGSGLSHSQAYFVKSSGRLFAVCGDLVFAYDDNYSEWYPSSKNLNASWVFDLESNSSSIIAATSSSGLQYSNDEGNTWINMNPDTTNYYFTEVEIESNYMVAAGGKSVYHSTDNGLNWTQTQLPITLQIVDLVSIGDTVMTATTVDGFFISFDQGQTWNARNNGIVSQWWALYSCCLAKHGDSLLYFNVAGEVFRSSDYGLNWYPVFELNEQVNDIYVYGDTVYTSHYSGTKVSYSFGNSFVAYHDSIRIIAKWNNYILASTDTSKLIVSVDDGTTWYPFDEGLAALVYPMDVIIKDSTLFLSTIGNGVWKLSYDDIVSTPNSNYKESALNVLVYPNPMNSEAIVEIQSPNSGKYSFKLVNQSGRILLTKVSFEKKIRIRKGNLSAGMYFYIVSDEHGNVSRGKIVIQ